METGLYYHLWRSADSGWEIKVEFTSDSKDVTKTVNVVEKGRVS